MPKTKGRGHSRATLDKAQGLSKLLSQHVNTVKVILNRCTYFPQKYYFIDAYAGPGYNEEEQCDGSSIIFLKTAKKLGIDYYAWFVEQDINSVRELRKRIEGYPNCEISPFDNAQAVPTIARGLPENAYGLVYADPNGIPDFDMLSKVSLINKLSKFDILIRYNATAVKRNEPQTGETMLDHLRKINKKYWVIREPRAGDIWQWTFLLGMNWDGLNPWTSQGFLYAITPDGITVEAEEIVRKLNYTKDERMTLGGWK
jgi:three-Cys-motif partner protein